VSRARRIILFVFGLVQASFGLFFWFVKAFMTGRTGTPRSYELAEELISVVRENGGTVPDADAIEFAIAEPIRREIFAQADQPQLAIAIFGICGAVCMLIAGWPASRSVSGSPSSEPS